MGYVIRKKNEVRRFCIVVYAYLEVKFISLSIQRFGIRNSLGTYYNRRQKKMICSHLRLISTNNRTRGTYRSRCVRNEEKKLNLFNLNLDWTTSTWPQHSTELPIIWFKHMAFVYCMSQLITSLYWVTCHDFAGRSLEQISNWEERYFSEIMVTKLL